MNTYRSRVGAFTRSSLVAAAALVIATMLCMPALAAPGHDVTIEIPDQVVRGDEGTTELLATVPVPPEAAGQECSVIAQGVNQQSVNSGNNLIVASGTSEVLLLDVEGEVNKTTPGSGTLVLGSSISVTLEFGVWERFSGAMNVIIDCDDNDPEPGRIIVLKQVAEGSDPSQVFGFVATYDTEGFSLSDGQSNDSGDLAAGVYSVAEVVPEGWSLISTVCDDQSLVDAIDLSQGEIVTCTFTNLQDEVLPSIVVTVSGECVLDEEAGMGRLTVNMPFDGAATVVISDGEGGILDTIETNGGTVDVPAGASYSWTAEPAGDSEFPPDFEPSGTIVIEDCSVSIQIETLGVCDNDAPYLYYRVDGQNLQPGSTVDIHWLGPDGVERTDDAHDYTDLPLGGSLTGSTLDADGSVAATITNANRVPWPGLRVDSAGAPTDWPGWVFEDGEWLQQDDGFLWARTAGARVVMEVNPTGEAQLSYPPATPTCSANPPDEVLSEEINDEVEAEELPFTGPPSEGLLALAAVLVGAGSLLLRSERRREES